MCFSIDSWYIIGVVFCIHCNAKAFNIEKMTTTTLTYYNKNTNYVSKPSSNEIFYEEKQVGYVLIRNAIHFPEKLQTPLFYQSLVAWKISKDNTHTVCNRWQRDKQTDTFLIKAAIHVTTWFMFCSSYKSTVAKHSWSGTPKSLHASTTQ